MTQRKSAGQVILEAWELQDSKRARSLQTQLGVSSLGGCRAQAWLQLKGYPKTNKGDHFEAMLGTAIHESMTRALDAYSFGTFKTEFEISHNGLIGHMDWYWEDELEVVDIKTMKKANAGYFPKLDQRWQVHVYAYLLIQNGYKVNWVTLVAFMRDGNSSTKLEWREPYDERIALEALAWLEDVKSREVKPAPEMPAQTFCATYCEWFGSACKGLTSAPRRKGAGW